MENPFKNTEPDFSDDSELQGQPDGIRFLVKITKAKLIGDFEAVLLERQKMLYVYGRTHADSVGLLCGVGNAWETLGRIDHAIAYHEEAIAVTKKRQEYRPKDLTEERLASRDINL